MSLTELFATDPLKLTKENLDEIIETYRKHRHQFKLTGITPPKQAKIKPEVAEAASKLDLGSLGL